MDDEYQEDMGVEQVDAADQQGEKEVPSHQIKSIQEDYQSKLDRLEEQNKQLYQMIQQQQESKKPSNHEDLFAELDTEEYVSGRQLKTLFAKHDALLAKRDAMYEEKIAHAQYQSMGEKIAKALPEMAKRNPTLRHMMEDPSIPMARRYQIATEYAQSLEGLEQNKKADADRIVVNASKPRSVNSAPYAARNLSNADTIKNMSGDDFEAYVAKVQRGEKQQQLNQSIYR